MILLALALAAVQPPRITPELEAMLHGIRDGEMQAVRDALDGGLPVDARAPNRMTGLHVAAVLGREAFVRLLLDRGADGNDPAGNGISPLHRAALGGHPGVIRMLLNAGAEVDAQADWGATPLLSAVERGHLEAVRLLLAERADPTLAARNGETPVSLARKAGREDILELLAADPTTLAAARETAGRARAERAATHSRTGAAFDDAGDFRRAIESYRLALEEAPADPLIRYRLGRALHRFGEREALMHLREAMILWETRIENGQDMPTIPRPALEDVCLTLRASGRSGDADRCDKALARISGG